MAETSWVDDLKALCRAAQAAGETARLLAPAVSATEASDVLPRVQAEPGGSLYSTLLYELGEIERRASTLFDRLASAPSAGFLTGRRLSAEEFYALRCAGIGLPGSSTWGLPGWQEYELYALMHYEDEQRIGWINPSRHSRPLGSPVGAQLGIEPEVVRVSALRPEQAAFFRDHLPEVFARFSQS